MAARLFEAPAERARATAGRSRSACSAACIAGRGELVGAFLPVRQRYPQRPASGDPGISRVVGFTRWDPLNAREAGFRSRNSPPLRAGARSGSATNRPDARLIRDGAERLVEQTRAVAAAPRRRRSPSTSDTAATLQRALVDRLIDFVAGRMLTRRRLNGSPRIGRSLFSAPAALHPGASGSTGRRIWAAHAAGNCCRLRRPVRRASRRFPSHRRLHFSACRPNRVASARDQREPACALYRAGLPARTVPMARVPSRYLVLSAASAWPPTPESSRRLHRRPPVSR